MAAIHEDYKHPKVKFKSRKSTELDVYIPELNLALEYQGEHHFRNVYPLTDLTTTSQRDQQKQEACQQVNSVKFTYR